MQCKLTWAHIQQNATFLLWSKSCLAGNSLLSSCNTYAFYNIHPLAASETARTLLLPKMKSHYDGILVDVLEYLRSFFISHIPTLQKMDGCLTVINVTSQWRMQEFVEEGFCNSIAREARAKNLGPRPLLPKTTPISSVFERSSLSYLSIPSFSIKIFAEAC